MKKLSKLQKEKLKLYWKELLIAQDQFNKNVQFIEENMSKELEIDDLEFFWCDGYCGIGNASKTIDLIHSYELEEE